MESKALGIVWEQGGRTAVDVVARHLGMSNEYARMVCLSLGRSEYIDCNGRQCVLTGKGKLEVAKKKASEIKRFEGKEVSALELKPPQTRGVVIEY